MSFSKYDYFRKMSFSNCEFHEKSDFENTNFAKNECSKMRISRTIRLSKSEFYERFLKHDSPPYRSVGYPTPFEILHSASVKKTA